MIVETKKIYKCEHCNKLYQIKNACISHEKSCYKNPQNDRACFICIHLKKKVEKIYYDDFLHESHEKEVKLFHCDQIHSFLCPPKVEHKRNAFDTSSESNIPMKKECEFWTTHLNE